MSIIKTNTIIILIIIDSNYYLVSVNRNSQQRCSVQKGVLKISQNSQGNTCARVSILITYFKKEALVQVLPCEFCEIFKNTSGRLLLLIKFNPLENLRTKSSSKTLRKINRMYWNISQNTVKNNTQFFQNTIFGFWGKIMDQRRNTFWKIPMNATNNILIVQRYGRNLILKTSFIRTCSLTCC